MKQHIHHIFNFLFLRNVDTYKELSICIVVFISVALGGDSWGTLNFSLAFDSFFYTHKHTHTHTHTHIHTHINTHTNTNATFHCNTNWSSKPIYTFALTYVKILKESQKFWVWHHTKSKRSLLNSLASYRNQKYFSW